MTESKPHTADIVERLHARVVIHTWDPEMGPLTGGLINPDGPEAAAEIKALRELLVEARRYVSTVEGVIETKIDIALKDHRKVRT